MRDSARLDMERGGPSCTLDLGGFGRRRHDGLAKLLLLEVLRATLVLALWLEEVADAVRTVNSAVSVVTLMADDEDVPRMVSPRINPTPTPIPKIAIAAFMMDNTARNKVLPKSETQE